ncbi:MAG: beta-fructosidase, levanase/invertase [Fibrobacteres bacterium]|nr:beta-fructosidase, levanase/invertase [Fibrobacterota bacterium]
MRKPFLPDCATVLSLIALTLLPSGANAQRQELPIADFEGADYAGWTAAGTAFGAAPARGTLGPQQPVTGYTGNGLVNTFLNGDGAIGTLESPPFTLQRDYLNFLAGGGSHADQTRVELIVDGKVVLTASGIETESLFWVTWDIKPWTGKSARLRIVDEATGGWGHILADDFRQSDEARAFREALRPQFHFTAAKGWINDPNGMVFYDGEYHLFYQHNPFGIPWGNMTWGHAVSPDMIHWQHLPLAIQPDNAACTAYSGSAVVDWNNTAGFQTGKEKALIILWTSIGCGQRLAYSNDRGRTWTKWEGNPVIPAESDARDPKVFWSQAAKKWIMALWTPARGGGISFYGSANLKSWIWLSIAPDFFECPNIWESPVDGNPAKTKWVLHGASGQYRIGNFDGTKFTPEAGPFPMEWGRHWYASQIFSDIPAADGRILNISWMNGGSFPGMPFNGQMSIPTSIGLRTLAQGIRVTRLPVKEIEALRIHTDAWKDRTLAPGENILSGLAGDLYDIDAEFELAGAAGASEFGFRLRDSLVAYHVGEKRLSSLDKSAPLSPAGNRIKMRILLDRASLEVFGNDGEVVMTSNFLPVSGRTALQVYALGGPVKIVSLEAHKLRGAWDPKDLQAAWEKSRQPTRLMKGKGIVARALKAGAGGPENEGRNLLGRSGPATGRLWSGSGISVPRKK